MLLPLVLILIATLSAAIAVYGTLPQWALYHHGLQVIEVTRQLQWPLFTISVLLCLTLAVLVIAGKRRIWWMVGFAPVLALFTQQFATGTVASLKVIEQPPMVPASQVTTVADDDYVVGLGFNQQQYAFPYRQLYHAPAIILTDRDKRMILMWSAFGNRAMAVQVTRQVRAREMDIVSMPANALLLYNGRVGQFINGFTGLTPKGDVPNGFSHHIPAVKTTWRTWKTLHPQGKVMVLPTVSTAVGSPVQPQYPMRSTTQLTRPVITPVVVFGTTQPVVMDESQIKDQLINTTIGDTPAMIFRDRTTGRIRAFARTFGDRTSKFMLNPSTRRAAKGVALIDLATNSGWNWNGVAVDGDPDVVGSKLTPFNDIEEDLYWGVMKEWYPEVVLEEP